MMQVMEVLLFYGQMDLQTLMETSVLPQKEFQEMVAL